MRLLSFAGGICMVIPGTLTDIVGAVVIAGVFVLTWFIQKNRKSTTAA